jgi:EPS-associated MarR family transcriptional regulator
MESRGLRTSNADISKRESLDFELLYLLETEPGLSQREIAIRLGISLGRVNYCLKALHEKGAVKLSTNRASGSTMRHAYHPTAEGIAQRTSMTGRFLRSKIAECERLKAQIEELREDMRENRRS